MQYGLKNLDTISEKFACESVMGLNPASLLLNVDRALPR